MSAALISLAPQVVGTLGSMRSEEARFWLEKVMIEGPPELRAAAASSLAQIGASALAPLKNALNAPTKESRGIRLGDFPEIRAILEQELEQVWDGKIPPKLALDRAAGRGNELLRKFEQAHRPRR